MHLAALGPGAKPASAALVRALEDPDDEVCVSAVRALAGIGPASASAVPAILRMMETRGGWVDEHCGLMPIGEIEKIGPAAVAPLVKALGTAETEDAILLLDALGEVSVPALARALADRGARAEAAAGALERLGPRAVKAIPAVLEARRAGRLGAGLFLSIVAKVGAPARSAAGDVVVLLRTSGFDDSLYTSAVAAIRAIHAGSEAVSALTADMRSPDPDVRRRAAATIGRLGEDGRDGVALLVAALDDADLGVRNTAVYALGQIGQAASAAVGAIIRVRDRGSVNRSLADNALTAIQHQP